MMVKAWKEISPQCTSKAGILINCSAREKIPIRIKRATAAKPT